MFKSEKKLKDLTALLDRKNNTVIAEAINLLRKEEPFEGVIGLLVSFYDKTDNIYIKKTIEEFMNDLKDQSVCAEIIAEIRRQWDPRTISMLVASCWQSGLNYSDYAVDFAKVYIKEDYVTAIECLTVIEESVNDLSLVRRNEIVKLINESTLVQANEKRELTLELISILDK